LQALLLLPSCPAEEVGLLRRRQRAAAAAAAAPPTQKHTYTHHMRITHERIHTTNARTHACVHTHTRTHTHTHTNYSPDSNDKTLGFSRTQSERDLDMLR
jgi:hypothetical protein